MKVFLDTEFLEGEQDKRFLGFKYGKTKPTIDLISIGLVSEDGQEYYAVSKEFNLYEAWNRYDLVDYEYSQKKVYWIRENVLKPIFEEMFKPINDSKDNDYRKFTYSNFKYMISKYGKTNKQIAKEILNFVFPDYKTITVNKDPENINIHLMQNGNWIESSYLNPEFYSYFGDYDWVTFCWLFGKMIDLPKGFPMYSKDLKQILDEKQEGRNKLKNIIDNTPDLTRHETSSLVTPLNIKENPDYPKQESEHNALADARWNKKLYEFLKTI